MAQALIIGKFMPPTMGHKFLIDFAINYPGVSHVNVIVESNSEQPIEPAARVYPLRDHYLSERDVVIHSMHKKLPQDPSEDPNFWQIWHDALCGYVVDGIPLIVFASEPYGAKLAEILSGTFVPVNIDREIYPISATEVRKFLDNQTMLQQDTWKMLLPEARWYFTKKVTIFGAESVGKTTIARKLAQIFNGQFIPEYARGYLEAVGTEVITSDKLKAIATGQYAQDISVFNNPTSMWLFRDTDLLTNLGYAKLFNIDGVEKWMVEQFTRGGWVENTVSDLYLILDDNIPLVKDPVRYGGDNRQSDTKFWVDICKQADVPYQIISSRTDRAGECRDKIREFFTAEK